jgi:O-antigen/teichoic acid export membrane protein
VKKHLTNATYGLLDYASYPVGMLLVAPVILRHLGVAEFGLWMVSTSVVSAGGIIASGIGDAGIQHIAKLSGTRQFQRTIHTVRSLFALHLILGLAVAVVALSTAPYVGRHLAALHLVAQKECVACLRIASFQILLRSVESLSVSVQRALQEYRGTVQISATMRILALGTAALVAVAGKGAESIMLAMSAVLMVGAVLQFRNLQRLLGYRDLWPRFYRTEARALLHNGVFVWAQVAGSVVFRQFDRILLGVVLGASAVTPYALGIQVTEPLFGLTASSMSFFFPYLAGRISESSVQSLRRTVLRAFLCNFALVSCGAAVLLIFGQRFVQVWAGHTAARGIGPILPLLVMSSAFSGLSVTGTYAVQALGLFRTAAYISLGSRSGLLLLMFFLLHHGGVQGLAVARVWYGVAALLVYVPLGRHLKIFRSNKSTIAPCPLIAETQGGLKL